jgi:hypothetical protein
MMLWALAEGVVDSSEAGVVLVPVLHAAMVSAEIKVATSKVFLCNFCPSEGNSPQSNYITFLLCNSLLYSVVRLRRKGGQLVAETFCAF